jgi:ABC-2 type transport system permease protein
MPPLITVALYFIIFGKLIGPRIGNISGFSYIEFIAPGLIMMWVIIGSFNNTAGSFFLAKFMRSIEELLVAPIPNYLILLGYIAGAIMRGFVTAILITIITLIFTPISVYHPIVAFLAILFSSVLFGIAGLINGMYAKTFDDIMLVPTFILIPLTYLGGTFYSIKMLPHNWYIASLFNPLFYVIDLFRYAFLNIADFNIAFAIFVLLICTLALFALCLHLFNKGFGIRS